MQKYCPLSFIFLSKCNKWCVLFVLQKENNLINGRKRSLINIQNFYRKNIDVLDFVRKMFIGVTYVSQVIRNIFKNSKE